MRKIQYKFLISQNAIILHSEWRLLFNKAVAEIDPTDEFDWCSLAYGWALAKNINPEDARDFAYNWYDIGKGNAE